MQLDRDQLNHAPAHLTAIATHQITDALQLKAPEVQVLASAAWFLMVCERYKIRAADVLTKVTNMLNGEEEKAAEFRAARMYMEHELG